MEIAILGRQSSTTVTNLAFGVQFVDLNDEQLDKPVALKLANEAGPKRRPSRGASG
jgi:hypothetical protein